MELIAKIIKRLRFMYWQMIYQYVPYNTQFRPAGVKVLAPTDTGSVEVLELRPPHTSFLDFSPQFVEDCSPYLKPKLSIDRPADFVAILRNGRSYSVDISNTTFMSEDNYLIDGLSFQMANNEYVPAQSNRIFSIKGFKGVKKYKGIVFSLLSGGAAKHYYYHWLFDAMPRLCLLRESGRFDQVDYFLVPNFLPGFQRDYLEHLGVPKNKIINEEVETHIQADYVMVTSYILMASHHPAWVCDYLYNSFKPSFTAAKRNRFLYISRGDAGKNRKVLNAEAFNEVLQSLQFEICYLTKMSIQEQAQLFNSAILVVGIHGAGLANLVFCEPGTQVLEIFPDKYVRHTYHDISNKRGLNYNYHLCETDGEADNSADGQGLNVIVDVPAVRLRIEQIMRTMGHNV